MVEWSCAREVEKEETTFNEVANLAATNESLRTNRRRTEAKAAVAQAKDVHWNIFMTGWTQKKSIYRVAKQYAKERKDVDNIVSIRDEWGTLLVEEEKS